MNPGPEDFVAEYYQQQVEMLEGFNEMDALAERGFVPRMSKVCNLSCFVLYETKTNAISKHTIKNGGLELKEELFLLPGREGKAG